MTHRAESHEGEGTDNKARQLANRVRSLRSAADGGSGAEPPLVNSGASVTCSRAKRARKGTAKRRPGAVMAWKRLKVARELTNRSSGQMCGVALGPVRVKAHTAGLSVTGVSSCRSAAACPRCAVRMGTVRRMVCRDAAAAWIAHGGSLISGVVTLSHTAADSADSTLNALFDCWRAMFEGSRSKTAQRCGIVGAFRSLDATHSDHNGFHPHFHFVLFVAPGYGWEAVADWHKVASAARREAARKHGRDSEDRWNRLQKCKSPESAASYAAKAIADASMHAAKSRCIFALLDKPDTLSVWKQWESAVTGRRTFAWIGRQRLEALIGPIGVDVESDAATSEAADAIEATDTADPDAAEIPQQTWNSIVRAQLVGRLWARLLQGDSDSVRWMLAQGETNPKLIATVLRC